MKPGRPRHPPRAKLRSDKHHSAHPSPPRLRNMGHHNTSIAANRKLQAVVLDQQRRITTLTEENSSLRHTLQAFATLAASMNEQLNEMRDAERRPTSPAPVPESAGGVMTISAILESRSPTIASPHDRGQDRPRTPFLVAEAQHPSIAVPVLMSSGWNGGMWNSRYCQIAPGPQPSARSH
ncbi:hypothetical protein BDV96DRAFT_566153 [Lophiotrema nucula]|uniref:Uncharacterized protein n=1 Tax=Lophiotrema nucula TaxID=690887 RepID=A0A6A5ZJK2_9PLEO|nr:hypothetical protein BDV96DRAFT_566153 [Lophiotrema nucula]